MVVAAAEGDRSVGPITSAVSQRNRGKSCCTALRLRLSRLD